MQIILPVAGFGSRLRPQTWSRPKPLVTVAGKTLIDHVLDRLVVLNPERVIFITGYLGDQIAEHIEQNYEFEAVFVEQEEMLGQSHAILQARDVVSGPALVLFPDMIFEADLEAALSSTSDGILWVKPVDDPSRFGVVVLEGDRVVTLVEKPDEPISNLAVMGIYYFKDAGRLIETIDRQVASDVITKGEYFLADAIQMMIDDGAIFTTGEATVWQDAGTTEALLDTNRYLLDGAESSPASELSLVIPPSFVDPSATIEGSVVGPHASIGPEAVIRDSIVRDSIVDAAVSLEDVNLERSIVGRGATVRGRPLSVNIGETSSVAFAGDEGD